MSDEIIDYELGPHTLKLAVSSDVFRPTLTSKLLAQHIDIPEGSVVLDVGCGSGPLAIAAAKSGAKAVYAVDIMEEACALARRNAELNGVADKVHVRCGSLFEPVDDIKFDVIIDDVSGIADEVARLSPWYPVSIPTGGYDGTGPTIRMLETAKAHLTETGNLYFPTSSLANVPKIVQAARDLFGDNLKTLFEKRIPFCPEFKESIKALKKLRDIGIIDFQTRREKHLWTLTIFHISMA